MDLRSLGWNPSLESDFAPHRAAGFVVARVVEEHRSRYVVFSEQGDHGAEVSGRVRHTASSSLDFPTVGDWVALQPNGDSTAIIHAVLPRRSSFLREAAGELTEAQILAANLDLVFFITDADKDFNPRRMERYLTLAWESGIAPVLIINKADLCGTVSDLLTQLEAVAVGVPILTISALQGDGIEEVRQRIAPGQTVALIGSSGVGKSTLINCLLGEDLLRTSAVRERDGRGRHTTTSRQLLLLPDGGVIIDTPGMRMVKLWTDEASLEMTFPDIEELAANCRFRDCRHASEPGCAVSAALEGLTLSPDRFKGYRKLAREVRFLAYKQDVRIRLEEQARWRRAHRQGQENMRRKYGAP